MGKAQNCFTFFTEVLGTLGQNKLMISLASPPACRISKKVAEFYLFISISPHMCFFSFSQKYNFESFVKKYVCLYL